jgi:uncharacterized protein (DUF2252 family)
MATPLTSRERYIVGRSHRKHMRRAEHAGWQPSQRQADPLQLLADSMRGRVPKLVSLKYDRMACSPFGFFRGAVPVMASDLALGPNTGIFTQLCGDAHVRNLGAFAAPDGRLLFDINDFDETIRGPFEWDVKRMAASLILGGREAGVKNGLCSDAAEAFLARYRSMMRTFARMSVLQLAHYMVHRLHSVEPISSILRVAERATPLHNLEALTVPASEAPAASRRVASTELKPRGNPRIAPHPRIFQSDPPVLTRIKGNEARPILDSLATYAESLQPERQHFLAQYTPLDIAFKVVGTGSVGLRDYCIYMQGNGAKDPLFLQIKEEVASGYQPYLGEPASPHHQGRRVVEGQRAMQFQSDPFLGWTTIEGRDFLVRQLNDHKASVELDQLKSAGLLEYAAVCGETLARGHARAGDPAVIAGYIGTSDRFDKAIARFASEYANQTERDWQALVAARRHTGPKAIRNTKPPVKADAKLGAKADGAKADGAKPDAKAGVLISLAAKSRSAAKRAAPKRKKKSAAKKPRRSAQ